MTTISRSSARITAATRPTPSTDHSREYVPVPRLRQAGEGGVNLGVPDRSPTSARRVAENFRRANRQGRKLPPADLLAAIDANERESKNESYEEIGSGVGWTRSRAV
jgi:hypothetical protein